MGEWIVFEIDMTELIDAKDVRKMLKVSLPLVYRMAERGQLPCVRIPCPGGGTAKPRSVVRFKVEDVLGFIERHYRCHNTSQNAL